MSPRSVAAGWTLIAAAWLAAVVLAVLRLDVADVLISGAGFTCVCLAVTDNRNKTLENQALRTHIRLEDAKHRPTPPGRNP